MYHKKLMMNDTSHFGEFPLFKKVYVPDDRGDLQEKFIELSKEEKLKPEVCSEFTDLGDGFLVPDISMLDKFQAMDALEDSIDKMDITKFDLEPIKEDKEDE